MEAATATGVASSAPVEPIDTPYERVVTTSKYTVLPKFSTPSYVSTEWKIGEIVWAEHGDVKKWPALVVPATMIKTSRSGRVVPVYFFGDGELNWAPQHCVSVYSATDAAIAIAPRFKEAEFNLGIAHAKKTRAVSGRLSPPEIIRLIANFKVAIEFRKRTPEPESVIFVDDAPSSPKKTRRTDATPPPSQPEVLQLPAPAATEPDVYTKTLQRATVAANAALDVKRALHHLAVDADNVPDTAAYTESGLHFAFLGVRSWEVPEEARLSNLVNKTRDLLKDLTKSVPTTFETVKTLRNDIGETGETGETQLGDALKTLNAVLRVRRAVGVLLWRITDQTKEGALQRGVLLGNDLPFTYDGILVGIYGLRPYDTPTDPLIRDSIVLEQARDLTKNMLTKTSQLYEAATKYM